jgi:hypothetical protein
MMPTISPISLAFSARPPIASVVCAVTRDASTTMPRARHLIFYFSNRSRESFGGAGDVMTFEEASEVEPAAACARCLLSVAIVFRLSAASVI